MNKRSIACAAVLAGLAAGLLAGCASPFQRGAAPLPGERKVGDLRVGGYNYVAACDVLTLQDFESAMGQESIRTAVRATFATRTYQAADPFRVYRSECERSSTTVAIGQYPTAEQLQRGERFLPGAPDDALAKALGVDSSLAFSDPKSGTFTAVLDNKIVKAMVNSRFAVPLMKLLQRRLRERVNHPAAALDVTRPAGKVAGLPYVSACRLVSPADYTQVLGLPADEGAIEAEYPVVDIPATGSVEQRNTCRIGSMPEKTSKEASFEAAQQALNREVTQVEVTVTQTESARNAAHLLDTSGAQPVRGLGDQAVFVSRTNGAGDAVQFLTVRKGTYTVEFRASRDRMDHSTPESPDTLRRLAAVALPRMT